MAVDAKKLAAYEAQAVKVANLETALRIEQGTLAQMRAELLGETPPAPVVSNMKFLSTFGDARKRLTHVPPEALRETVDYVRKHGRVSNTQLSVGLKITVQAASLRLSRATRDGYLRRVKQGMYEVEPTE